jgi:hypothetical protein
MNDGPPSSAEFDFPEPVGGPIIRDALESSRALTFLLENRRDYGVIVC